MSIRTVEYEHEIEAGRAYVRVRFGRERRNNLSFVIQLECVYETGSFPVVRYDTAHGYAHCDVLHPRKPAQKVRLELDFTEAFHDAQRDIAEKWRY